MGWRGIRLRMLRARDCRRAPRCFRRFRRGVCAAVSPARISAGVGPHCSTLGTSLADFDPKSVSFGPHLVWYCPAASSCALLLPILDRFPPMLARFFWSSSQAGFWQNSCRLEPDLIGFAIGNSPLQHLSFGSALQLDISEMNSSVPHETSGMVEGRSPFCLLYQHRHLLLRLHFLTAPLMNPCHRTAPCGLGGFSQRRRVGGREARSIGREDGVLKASLCFSAQCPESFSIVEVLPTLCFRYMSCKHDVQVCPPRRCELRLTWPIFLGIAS